MIITQLPRIRGKSGSGTSPCCFLTCFMCQIPNVQIEFVEVVNEESHYLNQFRGYHTWCIRVSFPWVIISGTWSPENPDQKRVPHIMNISNRPIESILFNLCNNFIYKSIRYGDIIHVALDWWYHSWCMLWSDYHTTVPDPWKSRIRNESLLLPSVNINYRRFWN